ncbi:MAG: tyrosine-type recombinase/integrase [Pirellulales bacterium]|nr:tyrosine-type recombinase/integrase [Pirellulales bacterium]
MEAQSRRKPTKITLNKAVVADLKIPATGRVYYHDARQPGLAVCVTAAGSKTFYLYRWHNGRPLRQRIGTTDEITVEQARTAAKSLTGEIVQGVDIVARKRAAREEMTFGELFEVWIENAKQRKRTWPEDQRKYDKFLITWAARRLSDIDAGDVERIHNAVKLKSGLYQANRVLELIKAMFAHAIGKRWITTNPAATVKKFEETSRDRYLRASELPAFFKALEAAPADQHDFFMLLLLTGQRRGAVQAMKWIDLDLDAGVWTIPATDSKNGEAITLPLVPKALAILVGRKNDSPFVFPSRGKSGHIVEPKKGWKEITTAAGLEGLRIHDLRRTLGSWQAAQGVATATIGKALGHAHGSRATHVYARLDLEPVRQAVTNATAAILAAAKPETKKTKTTKAKGAGRGKKAK